MRVLIDSCTATSWGVPLVGFNLGVEAGQLAVVVGLAVLLLAARRLLARARGADPAGWLAPAALRLPLSACVCAAGLWWLGWRAFAAS